MWNSALRITGILELSNTVVKDDKKCIQLALDSKTNMPAFLTSYRASQLELEAGEHAPRQR